MVLNRRSFLKAAGVSAGLGQGALASALMLSRPGFFEAAGVLARLGRGSLASAANPAGPYTYAAVAGGFEIINGRGFYNRPIWGPHCRDLTESWRLVAMAGDLPAVLLHTNRGRLKLGHLFLGLKGGRWFHEFDAIKARYVEGRQEYELADPCASGPIRLVFVRPVDFSGLLVRVDLPAKQRAELVVACGGATVPNPPAHYNIRPPRLFEPGECEGSTVELEANAFRTRRDPKWALLVTAAVPMHIVVADAARFERGPAALLASSGTKLPMAAALCATPADGTIYLLLTTDDLALPEVRTCTSDLASAFDSAVRHYRDLSRTVEVHTPDPYLDATLAAQVLALDASWHDPSMMHGTLSWHYPYAGWRGCYGVTVAGWHDRVQSHAAQFFKVQVKEPEYPPPRAEPPPFGEGPVCRGAIPGLLHHPSLFYNMGEVLLDMMFYDWLWTGDLDYMSRAFDFIADKLIWQDRALDPDDDGLYENWLNAWNTDAKWHNGGGCTSSSVYTWRANLMMANIARRLGKDPSVFEARAKKIKAACEELLWVPEKGVYAEYQDLLGLKRRHEAPDQSSVYTPIDLHFCDDFQAYQMLRFTEYSFSSEPMPRGGRLLWSSNWLPPFYSSLGLFTAVTLNLILCYYRLGLSEKADGLLRGIEAAAFFGPYPANLSYAQRPDGSTRDMDVDFTDTTSMFVRTVVEGLFGVQMNVPDGWAQVQPSFPWDWESASLRTADASYEYTRTGQAETLKIQTSRPLRYRVRLRARSAEVRGVAVNGEKKNFRIEPGIGWAWVVVETEIAKQAQIRVEYGERKLPVAACEPVGAVGEDYSFSVMNGRILEVYDPQGIIGQKRISGANCTVRFTGRPGWHTFFVLAEAGQVRAWLPIDLELRVPLEIVDARLTQGKCACAVRNNTQRPRPLNGQVEVAGSKARLEGTVPARGTTPVEVRVDDVSRLSPGTNLITLAARDYSIRGELTDWRQPVNDHAVRTVPLGRFVNQELATLHERSYLWPRTQHYTMTVLEDGRSWWEEWDGKECKKPVVKLEKLTPRNGVFLSSIGIPFAMPAQGPNACFTSRFENFPTAITIPVGLKARKLYFLLAASTNQMQSRIENGRLTVNTPGERKILPLINPDNLDDWLSNAKYDPRKELSKPYAQSGFIQEFGANTHGLILDMDLGGLCQIDSVELECSSNEVLLGLLGLTLLV
jgi:hypothetical protein